MTTFVEHLPPKPRPARRSAPAGGPVSGGPGAHTSEVPAAWGVDVNLAGSRLRAGADLYARALSASPRTRGLAHPHTERLDQIEKASACQRRSRGDARRAFGGQRSRR